MIWEKSVYHFEFDVGKITKNTKNEEDCVNAVMTKGMVFD